MELNCKRYNLLYNSTNRVVIVIISQSEIPRSTGFKPTVLMAEIDKELPIKNNVIERSLCEIVEIKSNIPDGIWR